MSATPSQSSRSSRSSIITPASNAFGRVGSRRPTSKQSFRSHAPARFSQRLPTPTELSPTSQSDHESEESFPRHNRAQSPVRLPQNRPRSSQHSSTQIDSLGKSQTAPIQERRSVYTISERQDSVDEDDDMLEDENDGRPMDTTPQPSPILQDSDDVAFGNQDMKIQKLLKENTLLQEQHASDVDVSRGHIEQIRHLQQQHQNDLAHIQTRTEQSDILEEAHAKLQSQFDADTHSLRAELERTQRLLQQAEFDLGQHAQEKLNMVSTCEEQKQNFERLQHDMREHQRYTDNLKSQLDGQNNMHENYKAEIARLQQLLDSSQHQHEQDIRERVNHMLERDTEYETKRQIYEEYLRHLKFLSQHFVEDIKPWLTGDGQSPIEGLKKQDLMKWLDVFELSVAQIQTETVRVDDGEMATPRALRQDMLGLLYPNLPPLSTAGTERQLHLE